MPRMPGKKRTAITLGAGALGLALVLALTQSNASTAPLYNGPLDAGSEPVLLSAPADVDESLGFTAALLTNTGDEPIVLRSAELRVQRARTGINSTAAVVVSLDGVTRMSLIDAYDAGTFYEDRQMTLAGYELGPSDRAMVVFRLSATTTGNWAFEPLTVNYDVGTRHYAADSAVALRLCVPVADCSDN